MILASGTSPLALSSFEAEGFFRGLDGEGQVRTVGESVQGRQRVRLLRQGFFVDGVGRAGKTRKIRVAGAQAWGT